MDVWSQVQLAIINTKPWSCEKWETSNNAFGDGQKLQARRSHKNNQSASDGLEHLL